MDEGTKVGELDLSRASDRNLLRRSINDFLNKRPRWGGITEEMRQRYLDALERARVSAEADGDARAVASIASVLVAADRLRQADEHLQTKIVAAEAGVATESNKLEVVYVNRVQSPAD